MDVKDFLNSKSMVTPAAAGAVAMLITNTLNSQFELPQRWVGLALSFVLGLVVFRDPDTSGWRRAVLYVVNSLVIFAMAMGTNSAGQGIQGSGSPVLESVGGGGGFFSSWL